MFIYAHKYNESKITLHEKKNYLMVCLDALNLDLDLDLDLKGPKSKSFVWIT